MADWVPREEWIKSQPQALLASCVLVLDDRDRMLLLRYGTGQPLAGSWWLPGGMLDHGEDPWTAARREMLEETGVELAPDPTLIGIDHRADVLGTGPVLDCFFYGGTLAGDTLVRLSDEHDRHGLFSLDELADTTLAATLPTLTALHSAALSGSFAYLREGVPQ
ncbi:NUDIX hydrolase [Streptomyces olivochromogenes]|uniref:NUDIX hydrolase n=1 Tax=Streptomyces olivochromogenes TaxID=1963 RepID=UPI001F41F4C2|nr:NUDIX hydrolase [Streptomyces olivochromogenes]MCF3131415.1 NUDIX hydrolase [Streptomyces olivochromogenes]